MIWIAFLIIFLDQLSKWIIQMKMYLGESISIVDNVFHLTYILNDGAAFGILSNQKIFFVIFTVILLIALLIYRHFHGKDDLHTVALGLILGGATGNLIDRLRLGAVVDFFDFRVWPIFNVADIAIVLGSVLLIYSLLFKREATNTDRENLNVPRD